MSKKNSNPDFTFKDYLIHTVYFLIYGLIKYFPSPIGDFLRYYISKPFILKMGKVRIYEGVTIWYPYRIKIGDNVTLNEWVYLSGYGGLTIGDSVRIGHRTTILSADHNARDRKFPLYKQKLTKDPVIIKDNVWIGCNVTILKGVVIGEGAIVGAGAVVIKSVKPFEIVAGVPAKKVGVCKNK